MSITWRRDVIGWSLYDFANTIYSMNILSLYFKRWVVEDNGREGLYYDLAYALSMLAVALLMPALGAISDYYDKKKLFLFLFTITCCLSLGLIPVAASTFFMSALILFAISNLFYEGGMVFYNALLYSVAEGKGARLVSGLGVSLGYTGSIIGMILVSPFVTGGVFGWEVPGFTSGGKAASFLPTAVLFFVFSLPLFFWVKERKRGGTGPAIRMGQAYRNVWESLRATKKYPGVLRFLIADYFVEDSVTTVILNIGIFSSFVLGFTDADLSIFLIISTLSAMLGAYFIGMLIRRIRLKIMMQAIIIGWIVALVAFAAIEERWLIYLMGSLIGILLGGLWTVSRPYLAEMVPEAELGKFFGLYALSGRAAAIIGPVIWGLIVYFFSPGRPGGDYLSSELDLSAAAAAKMPYRLAVISLMFIMAVGLFIFRKVPQSEREA